jgi:hypothetical protein
MRSGMQQRKAFLDADGQLRCVSKLPPLPLVEFYGWLLLLTQQIEVAQLPPGTLYCSDLFFQQVCDRCLELHGIDPDCCNLQLIDQLLFVPGDLVSLNLDRDAQMSDKAIGLEQWAAQMVAVLMDDLGLLGAIEACKTIPSDLLEAVLKERARIASKDAPDSEYEALIKELESDENFGLPPAHVLPQL